MPNNYPIVLAHGIARFDFIVNMVLKTDNDEKYEHIHYFRNIRTHLQANGFTVRHTNVDFAGPVQLRARQLKQQIEEILAEVNANKVHIIAHSLGGLDARRMLFDHRAENFHKKVASLTTLGSPHHGTPVADALAPLGLIAKCLAGIQDATRKAVEDFNKQADPWESSCGVRFQTYAGRQKLLYIFTPLAPAWKIINDIEGENDGLISVESAMWKREYFREPVLDADHLNMIGWWDPSEMLHLTTPGELEGRIKKLYLDICNDLAQMPS